MPLSANCPRCGASATGREEIQSLFGFRYAGTKPQSQCRVCRKVGRNGPSLAEVMKTLRFGIEIEYAGRRDHAAVAQYLSGVVGGTYAAPERGRYLGETNHQFLDPAGRKWKVVPDGSVAGGELVSPVLTLEDLPLVQEMARALKARGYESSAGRNCGIHIHLDKPEEPAHMRNFVRLMNHYEPVFLAALNIGSTRSYYCRPMVASFVEAVEKLTGKASDSELRAAWRNNVGGRYHTVNLDPMYGSSGRHSHNTVEIRAFNGTLHAGKIKSYVLLTLGMMAKARTAKQVSGKRANLPVGTTATLAALRKMLANVGCGNKTAEFHFANGVLERAGERKLAWSSFEGLAAKVAEREAAEAAGYYGRAV